MNALTVYPNSDTQYSLLKNLFKEMNIQFSDEVWAGNISAELTETEKKMLDDRLKSAKKGAVKSRSEFRKIVSECLK